MDPELLGPVLNSLRLGRHADFLAAEADYWRAEAQRLKARLAEIERLAQRGQYEHANDEQPEPPEPPVGTQYFDGDVREWFRGDLGWYCAKDECPNCPTQWVEVIDRLPAAAVRKLPGEVVVTILIHALLTSIGWLLGKIVLVAILAGVAVLWGQHKLRRLRQSMRGGRR